VAANTVTNNTFRNYFKHFAKKMLPHKFLDVPLNQALKKTGCSSWQCQKMDFFRTKRLQFNQFKWIETCTQEFLRFSAREKQASRQT